MAGAIIFSPQARNASSGFHPAKAVNGVSCLQRIIITFQNAGVSPIVVLTRQRGDIEQHLSHMGVICLGPDSLSRMDFGEFFEEACRLLEKDCEKVFLAPCDYALFHAETIRCLLHRAETPLQPTVLGNDGFPILASMTELKGMTAGGIDFSAIENAIAPLVPRMHKVAVEDTGVALNLREKNDWEALLKEYKISYLRPVSRFTIAREQVFLGPGSAQLLQALEHTDSVRSACRLTGISYSKGWQIIRIMEEQMGFPVVQRQKGGQTGGSACLTPAGKKLLKKYTAYAEECGTAIETLFEKHFLKDEGGDFLG